MDTFAPQIGIACTGLLIFFGPNTLLILLMVGWYHDNFIDKANKRFYHRVGVPCAGVITRRQLQKDGTMRFQYAYRPPNNRNMIYVKDYIREPKHESYPWTDDKVLVVLVVPGHCTSGLEVRKLSDPVETYWLAATVSALVTLIILPMTDTLIMILLCLVCPTENVLFEKIDVKDLSDDKGQPMAVEGDGEVSPNYVQDLSRRDMVPSLDHAEAVISSHLQVMSGRNVGSFEQDLLKYYDRCRTPARTEKHSSPLRYTEECELVEATPVISRSSDQYASLEENGDSEMKCEAVEQLPLMEQE